MKITHTYIKAANQQVLPASKQVKRIGQYLYKHIDGAYDFKSSSNNYDVYFLLLYELKEELREPGKDYPVQEMKININVTTYQNKVRINIIEITPKERTIGFDLYTPEKVQDMHRAYPVIMQKIYKRIYKAYENYYFLY